MKWISTILSIYLLAAAVLPCADEATGCTFDKGESFGLALHDADKHHHENDCSGLCSPFCICSCCQMPLRPPFKADFVITSPTFIFSDLSSLESILADLVSINDIWQPPKFS